MSDTISSKLDGIAGFKISSEGTSIGNKFGLLSFKISKEINKIGKALLTFEAGDMTEGLIPESDDTTFNVEKNIKIEAGYGNDLKSIFEGVVVQHSVDIASGNNATLQVECKELPFKATQTPKYKIFGGASEKISDAKIIKEVLGEYGLSLEVSGADTEQLQYNQKNKSDWETALEKASANGLVTVVNGKSVSIKAPGSEKQSTDLEYGTNIIEFNAQLNVANLYEKVTVESVSSQNQEALKAQATVDFSSEPGSPDDKPLNKEYLLRVTEDTDKSTLQKIADSKAQQISMAKIVGSCKFCGSSDIEIGKLIALKGFGKRFTGNAYISSLDHDFTEDGWTTTVKFGLPLEGILSKSKAPIQMKAASSVATSRTQDAASCLGLQAAVVTKLTEDPDKGFKIQVKILNSSGKEEKLWARLSNFWGNNAYGSFFIPEKKDEVILGFFNNDPSRPVILGTMYSSTLPPPNEFKEENPIQSITTKSKLKLEFDDEKKIITLETPGKNIIKISDEDKGITLTDQNKNKIELNDNGITIDSAKAITLKAKTEIKIEAGTALEAKAKTDFKIEGLNVEGKAKTAMKMAGTASAEFSASGNTTIKGAIVMIN